MSAASPTASASVKRCLNEMEWHGRLSAAARVILDMPNIAIHFTVDGAASITRLDGQAAHQGQAQEAPTQPVDGEPPGDVRSIPLPPGLRVGAARTSRAEKRRERNAHRLRAFQQETTQQRRERLARRQEGRTGQEGAAAIHARAGHTLLELTALRGRVRLGDVRVDALLTA